MSNSWYGTPEGSDYLRRTLDGMFMFVWEAERDDGTVYQQFDEITFKRALLDPEYILPEHLRMSVDNLPRDRIVRFTLRPTALTKKVLKDKVEIEHSVFIDLSKGEKFISYWLTDQIVFPVQRKIRRTVIGKSFLDKPKELLVISPSGATLLCNDDNQSYEGE